MSKTGTAVIEQMNRQQEFRAIFDPTAPPLAWVKYGCPVCGLDFYCTDQENDRYGFSVAVARCECCDLRFLSVHPTAQAYADFYRSGTYRRLVSAYHGREMGGCEAEYAWSLGRFLGIGFAIGPGSALPRLDIGGAPDGIFPGAQCTVIDPANDGQTAESFDPAGRTWDLITVCQTADHLLEPGAVFKKLANCLAPDGVLFFDVVDFDATQEYKIDHPCNFNARSAVMLAHVAGLRIDKMERSGNHLRFLCRHWREAREDKYGIGWCSRASPETIWIIS